MKIKIVIFCLICSWANLADANNLIKSKKVNLKYMSGYYPVLLGKNYQSFNQNIHHFIYQDLKKRADFAQHTAGKTVYFNYKVLSQNQKYLHLKISYEVNDMTTRYFERYYSIDLKTQQQVKLKDYLAQQKINLQRLNQAINHYLVSCVNSKKYAVQCQDTSLHDLLNIYHIPAKNIDILKHHDSFYIQDKHHIVVAFNSTKMTHSLRINIKTYGVKIL